ncbi:MAG TPA: TolC family protein [Myxococcota bacterium]|nr:TolC family protein [Myxococcota bacterium]
MTGRVALILASIVFVASSMSGCGTIDRSLQTRVATTAEGLAPAVDDDEGVVREALEAAEGREHVDDLGIPEDGTLDDFVRLALERSPSIRRAIRSLQAMGYRVPQVTSLADPMLEFLPPTGDMLETAAGMMDAQIGISQRIPFPGRLTRRGKVAEREVLMAFATLADVRIQVASDTSRAYYEYRLADVSIDVTRSSRDLLMQIRDVASARYRAGAATQQDVLRSEVEIYALTNELITLEQRRATARARLNALMNRPVDADLPEPQAFDLEAVDWKLDAAMDRAVDSNPRLVGLREQIRRDLESIRLARLEYFPDLSVGFGYSFIGSGISPVATGDDAWSLPIGLTLPIWWQRIRAGILEANARTLSSVEQLEETRNAIAFGLQDTLVRIDAEYRQAVLFRDLIVPRAFQAVEVSTAAYQAGDVGFTTLIENWRSWLEFSLDYHRALAGLEQRFADLQQLVGARLPRGPAGGDDEGLETPAGPEEGHSSEGDDLP